MQEEFGKMNYWSMCKKLKMVLTACGIDKAISSHCAIQITSATQNIKPYSAIIWYHLPIISQKFLYFIPNYFKVLFYQQFFLRFQVYNYSLIFFYLGIIANSQN